MLRADLFTFTTFDAVRCFAPWCGMYDIVVIISVPVMVKLFGVHHGKQVWNGDVFWTPIGAVAAGGAWNQVFASENLLYPFDCGKFGIV